MVKRENNYRLYRSLKELISPSISRNNITNYKIVLEEGLMPIKVFYPNIDIKVEKIIVFIHEDSNDKYYKELCKDLSVKSKCLVLAIDCKYSVDECYEVVRHIDNSIEDAKLDDFVMLGDSVGAEVITKITHRMKQEEKYKQILVYPKLEQKEHKFSKKFPKTLVITADLDPLKDEAKEYFRKLKKINGDSQYFNISNVSHGFLNNPLNSKREDCFEIIRNFIN